MLRATALTLACLVSVSAIAAETPTYGKQLEGFSYPHPLKHFDFQSQASSCRWVIWTSRPAAKPMVAAWC